MSARLGIVADFAPSGSPSRRRLSMLAAFYREMGFEVSAVIVADSKVGASAVAELYVDTQDRCVISDPRGLNDAFAVLNAARGFAAVHLAGSSDPAPSRSDGLLRIVEQGPGRDAGDDASAAVCVALNAGQAGRLRDEGRVVVEAPFLKSARRRGRARRSDRKLIAGCWVGDGPDDLASAQRFFGAVASRGGGDPPRFLAAGPGASRLSPPSLPHPVTIAPPSTTEIVFYRAVDLALFPTDAPGPRYDVVASLECGASPLVLRRSLSGLEDVWRLPAFDDHAGLAEYLFERGRDLGEGGGVSELRARADWTWSGLQGAAAVQRRNLAEAVTNALAALAAA